ncbi:MAG TPA: DUF3467 domain-containing protein [Desulfobacterales bacterium]
MSEDSAKQDETQNSGQPHTQSRIIWDDSNMRSSYANVANVAGGREEIVLLFGMNQSWHSGQKEIKVQLADRIVMSPYAAKRFAQTLNKVLSDYEARYGKLDTGLQKS